MIICPCFNPSMRHLTYFRSMVSYMLLCPSLLFCPLTFFSDQVSLCMASLTIVSCVSLGNSSILSKKSPSKNTKASFSSSRTQKRDIQYKVFTLGCLRAGWNSQNEVTQAAKLSWMPFRIRQLKEFSKKVAEYRPPSAVQRRAVSLETSLRELRVLEVSK